MERYHVRVAGDELVFSASHFITIGGDVCERLHGHNYRVAAEVHGPLDADCCVVDFVALSVMLRAILAELDHRVVLPTGNAEIRVEPDADEIQVTFAPRGDPDSDTVTVRRPQRWVFPRGDCVLLKIPNTTAELLARHIGRRLLSELELRSGNRPERVRVEVDECYGQSAACELGDE